MTVILDETNCSVNCTVFIFVNDCQYNRFIEKIWMFFKCYIKGSFETYTTHRHFRTAVGHLIKIENEMCDLMLWKTVTASIWTVHNSYKLILIRYFSVWLPKNTYMLIHNLISKLNFNLDVRLSKIEKRTFYILSTIYFPTYFEFI